MSTPDGVNYLLQFLLLSVNLPIFRLQEKSGCSNLYVLFIVVILAHRHYGLKGSTCSFILSVAKIRFSLETAKEKGKEKTKDLPLSLLGRMFVHRKPSCKNIKKSPNRQAIRRKTVFYQTRKGE